MYMNEGLDTGDMLLKKVTPISETDDFESLHDRLAGIGGAALNEAVELLEAGKAIAEKPGSRV